MYPIYKFQLSAGEQTRTAFPIYKDDLGIEYALEQGQLFYRGKLSGKLTFEKDDYFFITSKSFDTRFILVILKSDDGGSSWSQYWTGEFWKTDCQFDEDTQTVVVTPGLNDKYTAVLDGLEKEYNLIDLAPDIIPVKYDKRPVIQVYVPGQSVIGCCLSSMWWEQSCEAITDENQLQSKFKFAFNKQTRVVELSGDAVPSLPTSLLFESITPNYSIYFDTTTGGFRFRSYYDDVTDPENPVSRWEISDASTGTIMWKASSYASLSLPYTLTLYPVSGTGASGYVTLYMYRMPVYARYLCDVENPQGVTTHQVPPDDLVEDNRNYSRITPYYNSDSIWIWNRLTGMPLKWGIYQPGQYYVAPSDFAYITESFPIARDTWTEISMWFVPSEFDNWTEQKLRKEFVLKDAYPLSSVISVLLNKVAPGITHQATTAYSQFLYGTTIISSLNQRLFITPKSNVITSGYDQPAQKAMITLKAVFDMLRNCFRCYWFIDSNNRLRIEHVQYFRNGGSYSGSHAIGIDLTKQVVTRNGKTWAFGKSQYEFDKPEMVSRYQFGWMDDSTDYFNGYPIDIISGYVNKENVENINITNFTSDIDYILLNPGDVSKDGFVLLSASLASGEYKLPYYDYVTHSEADHYLQNGYVSFAYLQNYYAYDMPALKYEIDGEEYDAMGAKRLKHQTLSFPVLSEPDFMNLIRTNLGDGSIRKMVVNLSSRNANTTLEYDTE